MAGNKEKEVLMCIIEMYKDMPYLWQREHTDYMNKTMRDHGFNDLLEIYRNFDERATMKMLKKKIENMRTSYAKELKKVLVSRQSATTADEVYVPSLWYFDAFSFLESTTESSRTITDYLEIVNSSSDEKTACSSGTSTSGPRKRKLKHTLPNHENNSWANKNPQQDEEWEVYGRSIGFQMRDLNKRQLMISQKIISDVVFYAKLDKLSESSYVVLGESGERNGSDSECTQ